MTITPHHKIHITMRKEIITMSINRIGGLKDISFRLYTARNRDGGLEAGVDNLDWLNDKTTLEELMASKHTLYNLIESISLSNEEENKFSEAHGDFVFAMEQFHFQSGAKFGARMMYDLLISGEE
jgi:hypothetical protein